MNPKNKIPESFSAQLEVAIRDGRVSISNNSLVPGTGGIFKGNGTIDEPIVTISQGTNEVRFEGTTPQGLITIMANNSADMLGLGTGLEFHGLLVGDYTTPEIWLVGTEWVESSGKYAARIDYTSFDPGAPIKNFIEADDTGLTMLCITGDYSGFPTDKYSGFSMTPDIGAWTVSEDGVDATSMTMDITTIKVIGIPQYADDAAAGVGGLVTGELFRETATQALLVKT